MSLTLQQKAFCNDMMLAAKEMRELTETLEDLRARWDLNSFFTSIQNADLAADVNLAHLTNSNLGNAITALDAVRTALGDKSSGQIVNLIKLQG